MTQSLILQGRLGPGLEIVGDAASFPVSIARRLFTARATFFGRTFALSFEPAPFSGFFKRASGGGAQGLAGGCIFRCVGSCL